MIGNSIGWLLQLISLLCCLAAVCRLIQIKLFRSYPFFAWYFLLPFVLQMVVLRYGVRSPQICYAFPLLEPIRCIVYILVVWELVSTTFQNCAALRPLKRLTIGMTFIAATGLILTFAAPGSHIYHGTILSIVRFERGIAFSLGIFTAAFLGLTWKYSIKLPRNSMVLFLFWSTWFLGDSAMLMAASLLPAGLSFVVNGGLAVFEVTSYIGWTLLLSKADETEEGFVGMVLGRGQA